MVNVCDVVDAPHSIAMDRLSPWNKLKVKFSPFSESKSAKIQSKRAKTDTKRQKISLSIIKTIASRSKDAENSFIDDSNDENVQRNEIDTSLPLPEPKRSKFVSLNSSLLSTPNSRRKPTVRVNGYKNVNTSRNRIDDVESSSVSDNKVTTPNPKQKTPTPMRAHVTHIKNIFDGTRVSIEQAALEDSIIATDSEDDDEDNRRQYSIVANTTMPLNSSRLDLDRPASQMTIDSVSSFGSIQYLSQPHIAPMQKTQKRPKVVKGGLTELLQRSISKAKSDHAYWLNERQMNAPGERVLIERIERDCGSILVHCLPLNDRNDNVKIFCLDPDSKRLSSLSVGKSIEVEFNTNGYQLDSHTICYPNVTNILL